MVHASETDGVLTALHRSTHATLHALSSRLAHLHLSSSETNVLAVLADGRQRTVGELAAGTGTRPTTLTSVLDRLESKGHLVRALDPADRRSFLVRLTGSGERAAAFVQAAVSGLERSALAAVSDADIAGFHAVTSALARALP